MVDVVIAETAMRSIINVAKSQSLNSWLSLQKYINRRAWILIPEK